MCATFNITKSSMTVIQRELKRAFEITEKIMTGKLPWAELFGKHTFFTAGFKYYISVISTSTTKEAHKIWSGYVESKVRMLVQRLETHPSIALARAFNKGYERKHLCRDNEEIAKVQEGVLDFIVPADEGKTNEAAQQPQNGDASPPQQIPGLKAEGGMLVKSEPGLDDTAMPPPQQALKPENNGAVKAEDGVKAEGDVKDGPTEVYTTTHYIGLELNKGRSSHFSTATGRCLGLQAPLSVSAKYQSFNPVSSE
jgi:poly(A) polymerase